MHATILGTGSAIPSPGRVQTGVLIEDAGEVLLVDCGSGVLHRIAQSAVDFREVDTVLLTHHHLDHVADIPSLLKARVLSDEDDLEIVGPADTRSVVRNLLQVDDLEARGDVSFREIDAGEFELGVFYVQAMETRHSKQGFAYRVGDALAVSGDTKPFDELGAFFDGVSTLIHECAYPDGTETDGHTTPTELGKMLKGIDIDQVYLTHLFPAAEEEVESFIPAVTEHFDGDVTVATDGTKILL